jgi:hypothetical protein
MTPDTQQAQAGYRRPPAHRRGGATTTRSDALAAEVAGARRPGGAARPPHASAQPPAPRSAAESKRAREDASIVGVVPLLAVLAVTVAGVYIAWREGSSGGGEGGVIAGIALFAGAVARLLLPSRVAGLLATRKRTTDVATLAIFGVGLVVAGLVLPR